MVPGDIGENFDKNYTPRDIKEILVDIAKAYGKQKCDEYDMANRQTTQGIEWDKYESLPELVKGISKKLK